MLAIVVAAVAAGATFLLTGASGTPTSSPGRPPTRSLYGEARLDLPGDQAAEVADAHAGVPGLRRPGRVPGQAVNEALDELVGKASNGEYSWKTDIEPWFGGQVGGSIGALPKVRDASSARATLLVSVKDADKASAWAQEFVTKHGGTTTTESYGGSTITVVTPPADVQDELKGLRGGYVIVGPVLALGDLASLKAVIDTKGTGGLADERPVQGGERRHHRRPPGLLVPRPQGGHLVADVAPA